MKKTISFLTAVLFAAVALEASTSTAGTIVDDFAGGVTATNHPDPRELSTPGTT